MSIIIPVYNVKQYLPECIESVIQQSFVDIEIICIDDGSTDRSGVILDEYARKDKRIRVIHQENKGLSVARNVGIAYARSEYIQFVDSDDYLSHSISEILYNAMQEYDADIAITGILPIAEKGHEDKMTIETCNYYRVKHVGLHEVKEKLLYDINVVAYAKLFKKSFLEQWGIWFYEGFDYEDNYFTLAYLSICKNIVFIDELLYIRRFRDGSITDQSYKGLNDSHVDALVQFEQLFLFWDKNSIFSKYRNFFWTTYANTSFSIIEGLSKCCRQRFFDVVCPFILTYQDTIPQTSNFEAYRNQLIAYTRYKKYIKKDIQYYKKQVKDFIYSLVKRFI